MHAAPTSSPATQRRERVHDAVRELMAEQGFRVSMEAVASRAGCSKQTLYAHFGSKQELLRSVMQEHLDLATARLDDSRGDMRTVLVEFAMQHLQRLSEPNVLTTCQLLSAEAAQFPDEARALYQDGCATLEQRLANWLHVAIQRGHLRPCPPRQAAELLLGMIVGLDFERQRFMVPYRDDDPQRQQWAEFAVDAFLRAFTLEPQHPGARSVPRAITSISPVSKP
jgi:AcrR family transcriptional regulator